MNESLSRSRAKFLLQRISRCGGDFLKVLLFKREAACMIFHKQASVWIT